MTRRAIPQPLARPDRAPWRAVSRHPCACALARRRAATRSRAGSLGRGAVADRAVLLRLRSRDPHRPRKGLRLRSNPQARTHEPAASFNASYGQRG
jgi:hypothetical protein